MHNLYALLSQFNKLHERKSNIYNFSAKDQEGR